ncbi:MAG: hypothetical protein ATN36_07065 [Epulopiscium sp. Nele67-Bin005]|nr:MAG: hypothetical protein ATN36_07065 [Epulopiscium sp. Nele67-Bin005]
MIDLLILLGLLGLAYVVYNSIQQLLHELILGQRELLVMKNELYTTVNQLNNTLIRNFNDVIHEQNTLENALVNFSTNQHFQQENHLGNANSKLQQLIEIMHDIGENLDKSQSLSHMNAENLLHEQHENHKELLESISVQNEFIANLQKNLNIVHSNMIIQLDDISRYLAEINEKEVAPSVDLTEVKHELSIVANHLKSQTKTITKDLKEQSKVLEQCINRQTSHLTEHALNGPHIKELITILQKNNSLLIEHRVSINDSVKQFHEFMEVDMIALFRDERIIFSELIQDLQEKQIKLLENLMDYVEHLK